MMFDNNPLVVYVKVSSGVKEIKISAINIEELVLRAKIKLMTLSI